MNAVTDASQCFYFKKYIYKTLGTVEIIINDIIGYISIRINCL